MTVSLGPLVLSGISEEDIFFVTQRLMIFSSGSGSARPMPLMIHGFSSLLQLIGRPT